MNGKIEVDFSLGIYSLRWVWRDFLHSKCIYS